MTDDSWNYLDMVPTDDLPPMPAGVDRVLRAWCHQEHGLIYGRHYTGHFLDLLAAEGYTVERSVLASARSYTTVEPVEFERMTPTDDLTEDQIKAEDPTWQPPEDEERPVRSLG